jgi:hypothetical protein
MPAVPESPPRPPKPPPDTTLMPKLAGPLVGEATKVPSKLTVTTPPPPSTPLQPAMPRKATP